MRNRIIEFLKWLIYLLADTSLDQRVANTSVDLRARELVTEADTVADVSGEWKRHQVYAKLLKEFPGNRKRDLGLAIENALQW